jgi:hypothetical protein
MGIRLADGFALTLQYGMKEETIIIVCGSEREGKVDGLVEDGLLGFKSSRTK